MSNRLIDLNAETYFLANKAISELQSLGIPFIVTSTKRTLEEQQALYMQGRSKLEMVNEKRKYAGLFELTSKENSYTVTNCDGTKNKSNHQSGDALDIVPLAGTRAVWPPASDPRWARIAMVMVRNGFEWGGNWTVFPDYPHYQRRVI
jgi:peptidoglycan L-alanyl-D-glutamate endopeptidase CwlK